MFTRELRQGLLSERRAEKARLNEEADKTLGELMESVRKETERQQQKLRSDIYEGNGALHRVTTTTFSVLLVAINQHKWGA